MFRAACDASFLLLCSVAWLTAWNATRDLTWPCENDLYRDLAMAQSLLDGGLGSDPAYLGERWWYNPLIPALVASVSLTTSAPLHEAYAQLGTHLNLLAPLSFYALLATLSHRGIALAGGMAFLFLGQHKLPSWLHATYSPWLWTCNFAQAPFYLTLLSWIVTYRRQSYLCASVTGIAFGVTALAHTAPAVVLSVAFCVSLLYARYDRSREHRFRRIASLLAVVVTLGAAVSSIFWLDILGHYGGRVRNAVPLEWLADELRLERLGTLLKSFGSMRGLLAVVGAFALVVGVRADREIGRPVLLAWGACAVAGILYGYLTQRTDLPSFLPSWHFHFYLRGFEAAAFGVGVGTLASVAAHGSAGMRNVLVRCPSLEVRRATSLILGGILLVIAFRFSRYEQRNDLVAFRAASVDMAAAQSAEVYTWVLEHSNPDDVFLADQNLGLFAIAAAGRKTVALQDLFSNPYVDVKARVDAAKAMFQALETGAWEDFSATASRYAVTHVAFSVQQEKAVDGRLRRKHLRRMFASSDRAAGWVLYRLRQ
jgi:hypothetical protein